jgi:hypothetical protein
VSGSEPLAKSRVFSRQARIRGLARPPACRPRAGRPRAGKSRHPLSKPETRPVGLRRGSQDRKRILSSGGRAHAPALPLSPIPLAQTLRALASSRLSPTAGQPFSSRHYPQRIAPQLPACCVSQCSPPNNLGRGCRPAHPFVMRRRGACSWPTHSQRIRAHSGVSIVKSRLGLIPR